MVQTTKWRRNSNNRREPKKQQQKEKNYEWTDMYERMAKEARKKDLTI